MRNQLKIFSKALLSAAISISALAARGETTLQRIDALDEMSFREMINSVGLDGKSADLIRKFQEKEGRNRLYNKEYNAKNSSMVETYRNKEVLLITIPASKLFAPNEVEVRKEAASLLAPLKRYLREPDMYRVLLVMHTDNTGSEKYREHITEERSTALFDWFVKEGCDTRYLFSYAYGDDMPLVLTPLITASLKFPALRVEKPPRKYLADIKKNKSRRFHCLVHRTESLIL